MISGALFLNLNKEITLEKLLKKNFLKLILCLCVFSYLFCLMETFFNERKISANLFLVSLKNTVEGNSWDHLWYLYMFPGVYLFIPLLRAFIRSASEKEFKFTFMILFIFLSVIPTIEQLIPIKIGLHIPVTSIWFFYFLLGHAIHSGKLEFSLKTDVLLISTALVYLGIAIFIPSFQIINGAGIKLTDTSSIFSVLYSTGSFSLAKKLHKKDNLKITKLLSSLSLGIYIFHTVAINFAYKVLKLQPQQLNIFIMWISVFIASLISSCAITWLLRRIPFVKKYIL